MKKLLLILICLFVSFEVKSESDDLSGKKLLCERDMSIGTMFEGFEFFDNSHENDVETILNNQVIRYTYLESSGSSEIQKNSDDFKYDTNLEQIKLIDYRPPRKFIEESVEYIDRQTLELVKIIMSDVNNERKVYRYLSTCKLFDGDLYNHLRKIKQNFDNNLKSKQKI